MKYFLDTEFIEGFHKPLFGKRRHFVDLVSVGIVSENGQRYYAVSNDFSARDANEWVKKNVLSKLTLSIPGSPAAIFKSNAQIAEEIKAFIYKTSEIHNPASIGNWEEVKHYFPIDFYGYYADYDWVLFCSLFGTMMDLPRGFPMYCRDLKQMMDEKKLGEEWKRAVCPDPRDEHNALVDAIWNFELYKAILLKS